MIIDVSLKAGIESGSATIRLDFVLAANSERDKINSFNDNYNNFKDHIAK